MTDHIPLNRWRPAVEACTVDWELSIQVPAVEERAGAVEVRCGESLLLVEPIVAGSTSWQVRTPGGTVLASTGEASGGTLKRWAGSFVDACELARTWAYEGERRRLAYVQLGETVKRIATQPEVTS